MPSTRTKAILKNSEAIDLTRWSYDRQVSNAVDAIAAELQKLPEIKRFTDSRKRALKVLILNVYLRWLEAPSGSMVNGSPSATCHEPVVSTAIFQTIVSRNVA